jgi:aminopeptidase N
MVGSNNLVLEVCLPHEGNATTDDLWRALSQASGKDVNTFMVLLQPVCCKKS